MQVKHHALHQQQAIVLYQQQVDLLAENYVPLEQLMQYYYRMRIHLYMLAHSPSSMPQPQSAEEVWLNIAVALLQQDNAHQALVMHYLPQQEYSQAVGNALTLYPPKDNADFLLNMYYTEPTLRSELLNLWLAIGQQVPATVLTQALKSGNDQLRLTAIQCAAWLSQNTVMQFQHIYSDTNLDCCLAALFAGLLRHDPIVDEMLLKFSEQDITAMQLKHCCWLMALSAKPEFIPRLKQYAIEQPDPGLYYLALTGDPEIQHDLLKAMGDIKTVELAADAWWLLTGYQVAKQPRLVALATESETQQQSKQTIPSVNDAIHWWENHGQSWDAGQRYLLGEVANEANITSAMQQYAGRWFNDVAILRNIVSGKIDYIANQHMPMQHCTALAKQIGIVV